MTAARMVARVGGAAAGAAGRGIFAETHVADMVVPSIDQCSRTSRARSCALASALVKLVMA